MNLTRPALQPPDSPSVPSQSTRLHAGPLALTFEDGRIHSILAGGIEVWRSVMFLFRDPAWATPWHQLHNVQIDQAERTFQISFEGTCPQHPAITWATRISGSADGHIQFDTDASVSANILTSRAGLCVLHPLSAAGRPLEVEHADGRVSRSSFPLLVSPWQPFTQIRALRHLYAPGCWATCRMHGDVFEMEDQRNFSDASFKTYSRSNLMPRPYRLAAGEKFHQSVSLCIDRAPTRTSNRKRPVASVSISNEVVGSLPAIGLVGSRQNATTAAPLDFWRIQIDLRESSPVRIRSVADLPGVRHPDAGPRHIDVLLDDDDLAAAICPQSADAFSCAGVAISHVAVYPTTDRSITAARHAFPNARVGGGTPFFFTHLNRLQLPSTLDFVSFSTCPIVHVADDLSVMQSLATLPALVDTLRARGIQCPLHIGPVGIGMRLDPFAARVVANGEQKLAMAQHDPRDESAFGDVWAFAYVCRMAQAGAKALTFGHERVLDKIGALTGRLHPALKSLTNAAPEQLAALAVCTDNGVNAWIANLTDRHVPTRFVFPDGKARALQLDPYTLIRADWVRH